MEHKPPQESPMAYSPGGLRPSQLRQLQQAQAPRTPAQANGARTRLRLTVPAPAEITEEALMERYLLELWRVSERQPLKPGEAVQVGDEASVELRTHVGGRPVPGGARQLRMRVEAVAHLPGLGEALVGMAVGARKDVPVRLPADYPVASLRGVLVTVSARLDAASRVRMPAPKSPEALQRLGLGATAEEAMQVIQDGLARELAAQQLTRMHEQLLDALAAEQRAEVPSALVDEELRRRFEEADGKLLRDPAQREAALAAWRRDPEVRASAERRLRIAVAMNQVAEREGVQLTEAKLSEALQDLAASRGVSYEEAKRTLAGDRAAAQRFAELAWQQAVIEHLMANAEIRVVV